MYNPTLGRFMQRDPTGESNSQNLYAYCHNDPVNRTDPTGLWDDSGHFYTTYMVAVASGIDPERAYRIAYFSQLPDEVDDYDTVANNERTVLGAPLLNDQWRDDVTQYLHSLHGGGPAEVRDRQWQLFALLKVGKLEDWQLGLAIHAYGDAYAHTKYVGTETIQTPLGPYTRDNWEAYGSRLGHAQISMNLGHEVDIPSRRVEFHRQDGSFSGGQYEEYVISLFGAVGGTDRRKLRPILELVRSLAKDEAGKTEDRRTSAFDESNLFEKLARERFGSNKSYSPHPGTKSIDPTIDSTGGRLSRQMVQQVISMIKGAHYRYEDVDKPRTIELPPYVPFKPYVPF